ncbi:hypothetical protein Pcinc_024381 [Petrolisthes cinctipes]|uniref:Uncharacterized protein n=1 Tax=Petrolisthes cinctipes TaxID=88211 RepID=A0AAE1FAQ3_PETCI|nr:hypothetical protein Pcinc_024381 [Petrolisthes cinctipes]
MDTGMRGLVVVCLALVLAICASAAPSQKSRRLPVYEKKSSRGTRYEVCTSPECTVAAADFIAAMDTTVDPCQDFYQFACGNWIANNPVPDDASRWAMFDVLDKALMNALATILTEPINPEDPEPINKAKVYYAGCLDEALLETIGLQPLIDFLNQFGGWPMTDSNWSDALFDWQVSISEARKQVAAGYLINLWVFADEKDTFSTTIYIDQTSLGLARTILTNPGDYQEIIDAYSTYMANTASLIATSLGQDTSQIDSEVADVLAFEIALAGITTPSEERRSIERMYNPMTVAELSQITAGSDIDWVQMLSNMFSATSITVDDSTRVIVQEIDYLTNLTSLISSTSSRTLSNYIMWRHVKSLGDETNGAMREASFQFSMVANGVTAQRARAELCAEKSNNQLGQAIGIKYVESYFSQQAKDEVNAMVEDLRAAFEDLLGMNQWMDAETKPKAFEKAEAISKSIGYPDWYGNDTALLTYYADLGDINTNSHFQNSLNIRNWMSTDELNDYGLPADRERWVMPPAYVNAYYMPEFNSINFPAGILQSPFYRANTLQALNYGGIGQVIGHEITHGFDDQGKQNDKDGNAIPWWNNATLEAFSEKAQCIVDQYDNIRIPEGENIADNGGLREALLAYLKYVNRTGEEPRLPGLTDYTPIQLFFLSNANIWCTTNTDAGLVNQILTDPHSPGVVAGQQKFVVRPKSVSVMEGEDVMLRCVVDKQQGRVQWTKDGFALGFERHVPGYPRYTYLGDAGRGEHHLAISHVSFTDDGEYQCQVGPTLNSPPIWAAANVTVLLAPSSIRVEGYRNGDVVEATAGSTLHLRCAVTGARPPPSLTWYIQDTQVNQGQMRTQVVRSSVAGRWDVVSQLVVRVRAEDDGKNVSCQAIHPGIMASGTITTSITLSVPHQPKLPVIIGYKTGNTLTVGQHLSLICRVTGGNPVPSLLWYRDELLLDDTFGLERPGSKVTVNALDIVVQEKDDGVEYECRATSPLQTRPLHAATTLSVHYGPGSVHVTGPSRVEEGGSVSLRCQATEANPAASLSWFVNDEAVTSPGMLVSQVDGGGWLSSSQLVWNVEGAQDDGQVVVECRASHPALTHSLHHTLIITVVKAAGAPVLEGEALREVLSGSSVSLVCSSPGNQDTTTLRVYKRGQVVSTEVVQEGNMTRAQTQLRVTPADNSARVKCEVTSQASRTPKVTSTRLKVLFGPRDVSGSAVPSVADEGSIVTLTCLTSSSNPPTNITWISEGTRLLPYNTQVSPSAFSGSSSRSELQLTVTAEDNGRTFTCQADNGLGSPLHRKISLKVLHAPVWREVPAPEVNVWEGSEVVITAMAAANPGPVRYWWRRGKEMLVGAGGELRLGRVSRDMTANYTVSAYSRRGAINSTFLLNVQYGPESVSAPEQVAVSVGENVNIRCSATGNPVPHLVWTYKNHTLGSGVGAVRLVVPSVQPEDTGVYLCVASSNSNPSHTHTTAATKLIVAQAVSVSKDAGLSRGSWVSVGGQGRLVCHVKAHPPPTFTWTSEGRRIYSDKKFILHEPVLVDGLVSWMSVLEVTDVTPMDYRIYVCSATNNLGSDSTSITLRPPTRPLPPTDLKVINVTNVTVTLGWVPNMAGAIPESYTVRYKIADTLVYQYEDVDNKTEVTVGELQPGQEYLITTRATNHQGNSDYVTPPLTFTTLDDSVGEDVSVSHQLTSLLLLAIILAAVGLIALNVAIVICLLRRFRQKRNSIRSTDSSTKTTSLTTHANTSGSSPDSHQHHHTHHHHIPSTLTARTKPKPLNNQQTAHHLNQAHNEAINLASATPVLNKKHRTPCKEKQKIQIRAGKKINRKSSHNSRVQDSPGYTKSNNNNNSNSYFAQARLMGNMNSTSLNNRTAKKSPTSVHPEARSLIPHRQERDLLPTIQMTAQDDQQDDQTSDTSNESTETAIYLDNVSPPPPPSLNMKAQQLHEDPTRVLLSSGVQKYKDEATQHTWQHEPLPSNENEIGTQAHQAGITSDLQNAIMQRREQTRPQIHIPEEPEGLPDNEQLMFPQSTGQQHHQIDQQESDRTAFNHLVHSSANVASYNILNRAQQLSELNHQNSTSAQHRHRRKVTEMAPVSLSTESNQQNVVTVSPGQKRRHQHSTPSQRQHHTPLSGRIPNLPVQMISPGVQHHLSSLSDLSPGVREVNHRHPSSIRTELNSPSRSQPQVKQRTPPQPKPPRTPQYIPPHTPQHPPPHTPDISYRQSPQLRHELNQTAQTSSNPKQLQTKPPSPSKRSSYPSLPPPSPSTRVRHQQSLSPQNLVQQQQQQSLFTLSHQIPNSPPSLSDPSWQHHQSSPVNNSLQHPPTSTPPSFNQPHHPPGSIQYHPTQTPPSPSSSSSSQHHLTSSLSPSPLHHLPPTPPGSVPRRPPPTPPRLRHQHPPPSPSPATENKLPLTTPSTPVSHHPSHLHSSRFTQTPRPVHSRQQSKIAEFRKSISRSLEDYHSHAATHQEGNQGYQEHKNSATTQKGTLHAKPTLINSSGVSTSLPKDINWRTDTHAGHEAYVLEMGQQQQQQARRLVHTLVDDLTPAATSSPITSRRRRTRFPDDFLWQGGPGRM